MIRTAILAALALVCVTLPSEARQRHRAAACVETGTLMNPVCGTAQAASADFLAGVRSIKVTMHRERVRKGIKRVSKTAASRVAGYSIGASPPRYGTPTTSWADTTVVSQARAYMAGIVAPLAAKVAEIQAACGSRPISGMRHTYIAGTRRISLHASGKAVDMAGNPGCIYAHLSGWQGGYSTDYGRMRHVHISYDPDGGREWGLHFRHGGGHRSAKRHHGGRYAHRHHRRLASAP